MLEDAAKVGPVNDDGTTTIDATPKQSSPWKVLNERPLNIHRVVFKEQQAEVAERIRRLDEQTTAVPSPPPPPSPSTPVEDNTSERGWALVILTASFTIHFLIDGVCLSYGVFYMQLIDSFQHDSKSKILTVGSVITGVYQLVGPFVGGLTNVLGCRIVTVAGSIIAALFIALSSLAPSIDVLLITYSLLGGIGFGMMFLPSIVMVSFYFSRRRALATGITVCGTGVGMLVFSYVAQVLMDHYGWRGANLILAGLVLNGVPCGMTYRPLASSRVVTSVTALQHRVDSSMPISGATLQQGTERSMPTTETDKSPIDKCRENESDCRHDNDDDYVIIVGKISRLDIFYSGSVINTAESTVHVAPPASCPLMCHSCCTRTWRRCQPFWVMLSHMVDRSPFRSVTFNVLNIGTVVPFLGLYVPFSCISHDAVIRLSCSDDEGTLLLLLLGATNTVGRVVSGFLSDLPKIDCVLFHNVSLLIAGVITCFMPLFNSYGLYCFYLCVFGPTIAVFITLKSIVIVDLLGLDQLTSSYGLTALFDGIATIGGAPISGALYDHFGETYQEAFIVAGLFMVVGGLICLPLRYIKHWSECQHQNRQTHSIE